MPEQRAGSGPEPWYLLEIYLKATGERYRFF